MEGLNSFPPNSRCLSGTKDGSQTIHHIQGTIRANPSKSNVQRCHFFLLFSDRRFQDQHTQHACRQNPIEGSIDEDTRNLYRKAMAAFGGIAPTYHIELLEKPTIYWDFHSLLLGIQMMFSFMLVDDAKPLRLCKHCQKVFLGSRANSAFCSARCKNQYNVYKSRGKNKGQDGEEND